MQKKGQQSAHKERGYDVFISYRHLERDAAVAKKLARLIETYKIPGGIKKALHKKRMGKVFRDQDELPTSVNLGDGIEQALRASEWLVVICSPELLTSKWCMKEIDTFIALGRRERILTLLVSGEPRDSFPKQLRYIQGAGGETVEIEPLAADIRGDSLKHMLKKLRTEKLRLLAPILGVGYDDLRRRARERRLRAIAGIAAGVAVVLGAFSIYAIDRAQTISVANARLASQQVVISDQRDDALYAQSKFVTSLAKQAYAESNRDVAALAALAVLPKDLKTPDRPYYPDAVGLLRTMEIQRGANEYGIAHVYPYAAYRVRLFQDGTVDVFPRSDEAKRRAEDPWSFPSNYYYLSADRAIALEQVAYTPDDPSLPAPNSAHAYYEVRAYDYATMTLLSTFRPFKEYGAVMLSVSGRYAAAVSPYEDTGVVVWDVYTGERLLTVEAANPAAMAERRAAREKDPHPGVTVFAEALGNHTTDRVGKAIVSADGSVLTIETRNAEGEPMICGYSVLTGERLWEIASCYIWTYAENGGHFAAYESDRENQGYINNRTEAYVYSTVTGEMLMTLKGEPLDDIAFGGDKNDVYLFAGGILNRYPLDSGAAQFIAALNDLRGIWVSADSEKILIEEYVSGVGRFDVLEREKPGMTEKRYCIGGDKSGDEQLVFLYSEGYAEIDVYAADTFKKVATVKTQPSAHGNPAYDYPVISNDGSRIFFLSNIYDTMTGEVVCNVPFAATTGERVRAIGFSPDNTRFLLYEETYHEIDGQVVGRFDIRCYDAESGKFLFSYGEDLLKVNTFDMAIMGNRLYVTNGYEDYGLSAFDLYTGEALLRVLYPNSGYRFSSFSPDGTLAAIMDSDSMNTAYDVRIYELEAGTEVGAATIEHACEVGAYRSVLFKDSETYYAISTDSVVEVDVKSGQIRKTVISALPEVGIRNSRFESVSADRTLFISQSGHIWRLTDGALYAHVPSLTSASTYIMLGNERVINFHSARGTWFERGENRRYPLTASDVFTLRTDEAVFEAAGRDMEGKALLKQEREQFFLD